MKTAEKNDPYSMNQDLRLSKCLYCGQARHDRDARFCIMCGNPIVNKCSECPHRNIAIARYCEKCGRPTLFFLRGLLQPFPAEPSTHVYHQPPDPPEGLYARMKRLEDERAAKKAAAKRPEAKKKTEASKKRK